MEPAMSLISQTLSPLVSLRLTNLAWLLRGGDPHVPRINPNDLPDYLRRDLGLSGGRTSPPRDPLRD
jgi:hypothetical protein